MPEQKKKQKKTKKTKYALSCGVIIFNIYKDKPQYLLVKYPTYWGFVRGKVEPGETEELTAFREALEEVSLQDLVFIPHFREVTSYAFKRNGIKIRKDDVYLLAKTNSWNVHISHEHEDIKWCNYNQALSLIRIKAICNILTKANELIKQLLNEFY